MRKEVSQMKYLVTFFWAFLIGQAVCYLGSALQSGAYNFPLSTGISLFVGLMAIIVASFVKPKQNMTKKA